jgi:hypothetical protein
MMIILLTPRSALEWVLLLAIASCALCLMALGTMLIVHKGLAMGADRAIHTHSIMVTLLIAIAAAMSWYAVLAVWMP